MVLAVQLKLVSIFYFPVLSEFTGNLAFSAQIPGLASEFSPQKQSLGQELPVRLISEFLAVCREWNARNREFRPPVIAVIRERVVVKWEAIVVIRDGVVVIRDRGGVEREAIVATWEWIAVWRLEHVAKWEGSAEKRTVVSISGNARAAPRRRSGDDHKRRARDRGRAEVCTHKQRPINVRLCFKLGHRPASCLRRRCAMNRHVWPIVAPIGGG